MHTNNL
jgi:hypothetical protein